jgi:hypothetical protein
MEQSIRTDLSFEEYLEVDAFHNSCCKALKKSPAHLKYELDNPSRSTPAQLVGEVSHCLTLEPLAFAERYAIAPKLDKRFKDQRAQYVEFCESARGKTVIDEDTFETATSIATAVLSNKAAAELLREAKVEVSLFWVDPETQVPCKARADLWAAPVLADLKTCRDARIFQFAKTISDYGYYRQLAFYRRGLRALGQTVEHSVLIAVEAEPPHGAQVYRLLDEILVLADRELDDMLKQYKYCKANNHWPGYPEGIEDIGLPVWKAKELEGNV